ncbi:phospholipase C gamma [Salpingoeca rosetta]|uniref:Phosphoinositide phospholipase C n=1 Tax=Salpingoeca rosetta (strain ATCC 50818 / BSB-021) TaxID=946362 RepID=F2U5I3_SALR5|nr:phospholipase C gamma [Salpingoeca rosetta]EGD83199.1 phospholipase C gamma [Salpingoeca rosetta]|eukprot:XP_004995563.1 phospholipase C gamma [Salpingoeca rosetta]
MKRLFGRKGKSQSSTTSSNEADAPAVSPSKLDSMIRSAPERSPPQLPLMLREYKPHPKLNDFVQMVTRDCTMDRYLTNKKMTKCSIKMDFGTFNIVFRTGPGRRAHYVPLHTVCEVRTGEQALACKDFKLASSESKDCALVILHGDQFRLKQLCLVAQNAAEAEAWAVAVWEHSRFLRPDLYMTHMMRDRWLQTQWDELSGGSDQIGLRELKTFATKINYKLSARELRDYMYLVDEFKQGIINREQFTQLYHHLVENQHVTDVFRSFSSQASKTSLTEKDLQQFFRQEQNQQVSIAECKEIIKKYGKDNTLPVNMFVEFLHSNDNHIWNPDHDMVYQDMHLPLACYFIASSHNTYLMGDQLRSESSVEAYVRCLRDGCRCVEIDCWDGPYNEPIVYHGHTLTSKIKFQDVVKVVSEHAFDTSEYPLILSIENHCSLSQQEVMARMFQEAFGDYLITRPPDDCQEKHRDCYPSPEQLKYKVIIKHKKLEGQSDSVVVSRMREADLSFSVKNGHLLLEDKLDEAWKKHYFVLTETKLFYAEALDEEEEEVDDDDDDTDSATEGGTEADEPHFREPWFHGKLVGGRVAAEDVLKKHLDDPGTFLVRPSDSFKEEYSLSFVHNGRVQHCRIRKRDGHFYLTDTCSFATLYELIDYYRQVSLQGPTFTLTLRHAAPQPAPHESERWFHADLPREQAEDMLKRIHHDGAFLVRGKQSDPNSFAISFRAEGKIKHCRIRLDGRMYCIGDAEFDSLVALVDYYKSKPLYRKMKLKYAVDQELIDKHGQAPEEDIYNSDALYQEPNAFEGRSIVTSNVTCRALYSYGARNPDELTFPKDAIITNVIKRDDGWWQGDYGGLPGGWFPSNYVEEIDHNALMNEDKDDADNPLGALEKADIELKNLEVVPLPARGDQAFIFAIRNKLNPTQSLDVGATTKEDMMDWIDSINRTVKELEARNIQRRIDEKKLKIHRDLSALVFYSQSVPFRSFEENCSLEYFKMSSFSEKKAMALVREVNGQAEAFNRYNIRQLSRVYPNGKRVDSSNFDPRVMWNAGMQLVALNYQTPDRAMWLNHGKFQQNGRCGYVLKPQSMLKPTFNPYDHKTYGVDPVTIHVRVISGRHLLKPARGIASPFVEVDLVGIEHDKYKTKTCTDNGFCPAWVEAVDGRTCWNEEVSFNVDMPELACLRIVVQDEDMFGDANTIGQNVYPLGTQHESSIRTGYRSIQLKNAFNEPLELSSILVHIRVEYERSEEYQSLQELRENLRRAGARRDELIKETLLQQQQGKQDQVVAKQLQQLNHEITSINTQIMSNPVEMRRLKQEQQDKLDTRPR